MQEDIGEKTKSSLFWNTFLPNLSQIYKFAISILIIRMLEPKDFGIMGIAGIIIFYSNSISNFGLNVALIQRKEINENHINTVFSINLIISIVLTLLVIFFSKYLANFFEIPELKNVLQALSAIFIITTFYFTPLTLARREINFKTASLAEFYGGLTNSGVALLLAYLGYRYWSLVYGLIASSLICTIFISVKVRWMPKIKYDLKSIKEIINFGFWNFLSAQVRFLANYAEKLIIGKFMGPVFLGFYDKAYSFAYMPVESISDRIGGVMFSSFSRNQTEVETLKEHFMKSISTASLICFPFFAGLVAIAKYFVIVLLGDKWVPMIVPLQILLIAFTFSSLISIISAINIGAGNYKSQIKRRIYSTIFMVMSCLYFVRWGINIVALVIVVRNIIFFVLSFNLTRKLLPVSWFFLMRTIFPALSGSIIMFIIVKLFSIKLIVEINIISLFLLSLIGLICYLLWIFIIDFKETRFLKEELKNKIINIKQRIVINKG